MVFSVHSPPNLGKKTSYQNGETGEERVILLSLLPLLPPPYHPQARARGSNAAACLFGAGERERKPESHLFCCLCAQQASKKGRIPSPTQHHAHRPTIYNTIRPGG